MIGRKGKTCQLEELHDERERISVMPYIYNTYKAKYNNPHACHHLRKDIEKLVENKSRYYPPRRSVSLSCDKMCYNDEDPTFAKVKDFYNSRHYDIFGRGARDSKTKKVGIALGRNRLCGALRQPPMKVHTKENRKKSRKTRSIDFIDAQGSFTKMNLSSSLSTSLI